MTTNLLLDLPATAGGTLAALYPGRSLVTLTVPLTESVGAGRVHNVEQAELRFADGSTTNVDLESTDLGDAITELVRSQFEWERRPMVIVLGEDAHIHQAPATQINDYQVSWDRWDIGVHGQTALDAARSAHAMQRQLSDAPAVFTVAGADTCRDNPPTQFLFHPEIAP